MASTSDRGEDKENDLDTTDVQLAIDEGRCVDPTSANASALTHSRRPDPNAVSDSTTPPEQDRKMSPTAGVRKQAFKLDSAASAGEDSFTEEKHSEQSTEVQTVHWLGNCILSAWCVRACARARVCCLSVSRS